MTNPEKEAEKNICGDHCDQQQSYGDGHGEDLWDAFELLEIDGNDERSSEQVTGNENWCSVCKVSFMSKANWGNFNVVSCCKSQYFTGIIFYIEEGPESFVTMALFKGIPVNM